MDIHDKLTVRELAEDVQHIKSFWSCANGHRVFDFKMAGILRSTCTALESLKEEELRTNAVMSLITQIKTARFQLTGVDNHYYIYPSNEMLIQNYATDLFQYHENIYQYAFDYQKKQGNFGDFKAIVEELDDPYYEIWVMGNLLKKD